MTTPRTRLVTVLGLLCLATACSAAGFSQKGQQVTGSNFRFTVLSPTLIRLEYSASGKFVDDNTVLAQNRIWSACPYTVKEDGGSVIVTTKGLQLRYRPTGSFSAENLLITWADKGSKRQWRPGDKDSGNLGGTRGALDGIGRGQLPPLDPGLLSRSGYTFIADDKPLWLGAVTPPSPVGRGAGGVGSGWLAERPDRGARDWYFFLYGQDYSHFLQEYVNLAGKIPMLPNYALGAWYSRYWPYKDSEEREIVNHFRRDGFPLDVLVVDVDWHKCGWEGYDWDPKLFPDPQGFLDWVHAQGVKVSLNNHPGSPLPVEDTHHAEACRIAGADPTQPLSWDLAKQSHAKAFQEAVHWPLEKMGVDFWWIDGCAGSGFPNLDSNQWCAQVYYDGTQRRTGNRSLVFSRYGGLGQHRTPAGFSGDVHSDWEVLNYEIRYTARAGNVLFPYWSHDIGGFLGDKLDPELYVRWCQFGALSPVLRLHSNHGVREPWNYRSGDEEIVRRYFQLRERLYPYLNTLTRVAHDTGMPLCRPLYLAWPERPEAYTFDYEYMLGSEMLVAPVATSGRGQPAAKEIWFPPGTWLDYWTGEVYRGPSTVVYAAPLGRAPMFVRAGGIIPMQPNVAFIGQKPADPLTVDAYAGADGAFNLYEDDGVSLDYQQGASAVTAIHTHFRDGNAEVTLSPAQGTFAGQPTSRALQVQLNGVGEPASVTINGQPVPKAAGLRERDSSPGAAVPAATLLTWRYDRVHSRVAVSVPSRSVHDAVSVHFVGIGSAEVQAFRGEIEQLRHCAADAVSIARDLQLAGPALASIQDADRQTQRAVFAAGRAATVASAREYTNDAVAATATAFKAVGAISGPSRERLLAALIGASASAAMEPSGDSTEVRTVVGVNSLITGCTADATAVIPAGWPVKRAAQSRFFDFAHTGVGELSFVVGSPANVTAPPLGLLEFGAKIKLAWQGVTLDLPAVTGIDCSFVQQWHVIGPFKYGDGATLATPYPPEAELDFAKSYAGLAGPVKWQATHWQAPGSGPEGAPVFINLETMLTPHDKGIAYAVAYVISDEDQDATLSVGSDDGCWVWLNGEVVLKSPAPRPPAPGDDRVNVRLRKGANTVLYKVAQEGGQWGLYLQIVGRDGQPLEGLQTTLQPPK